VSFALGVPPTIFGGAPTVKRTGVLWLFSK
jgi:hypothetical protein